MTPQERVRAAIAGGEVDRPPVSVWRHFPEQDQAVEDLAGQTVTWQERYDWDFVKFMPPGDYPTIDWGAVTEYEGAPGGTRTTKRPVVQSVNDWESLQPVDVGAGFNGMVLEALRVSRERIDADVPLLQTIFSPLTIAQKLANGQAVEYLRSHPSQLHAALRVITDITKAMAQASYTSGADGIFFATQLASFEALDETEYRTFGLHYDLEVLDAARETRADGITLLHTHGESPMFELAQRFPVDILNWHDKRTPPSLADGQRRSGKAVAGGINEQSIADDSVEQITADARDAIASTGGRHVLVTPGCVIPYQTPEDHIATVGRAVREHGVS